MRERRETLKTITHSPSATEQRNAGPFEYSCIYIILIHTFLSRYYSVFALSLSPLLVLCLDENMNCFSWSSCIHFFQFFLFLYGGLLFAPVLHCFFKKQPMYKYDKNHVWNVYLYNIIVIIILSWTKWKNNSSEQIYAPCPQLNSIPKKKKKY